MAERASRRWKNRSTRRALRVVGRAGSMESWVASSRSGWAGVAVSAGGTCATGHVGLVIVLIEHDTRKLMGSCGELAKSV